MTSMYSAGGMSLSMIQARTDRRSKRAELPDDIAKKLKSCSVLNCEEWRDLQSFTTYHCFPTGEKNQERWEIWTQLLRKAREDESWIPFRGSLVCSHHFRAEDFVNDPLSKRRKLIKNAVPSVFPSFTVDLEDPTYHLSDNHQGDDDNENNESEAYQYADNESALYGNGDDSAYEYEYPTEMDEDAEDDSAIDVHANNEIPEEDDNEIQIITNNETSISGPSKRINHNQVHLLAASSVKFQQHQQRAKTVQNVSIPTGRLKVISPPGRTVQSQSVTSSSNKLKQQSRPTPTSGHVQSQQQRKLARFDHDSETAKALSALPFSLNPDLEIEMIDPSEDLAACRLRISELEQENKSLVRRYKNAMDTLRHKYESQISALRQRLREQERYIAVSHNSSNTNHKKLRLS